MKSLGIFTIILTLMCSISAQETPYKQQLKLIPVAEEGDYGSMVDTEGDWLMVGAEDAVVGGVSSGTIYVYNKSTGVPRYIKNITPSDGSSLNRFGNAISVENNTMVVGAWSKGYTDDGTFFPAAGKIYIYEKDEGGTDNWGELKDIQSPVPASSEYFGFSVDIGENVIAVGAYGNDDLANNAGKVYLYGRNIGGINNWGLIKAITQPTAGINYQFGIWVEVSDNYLVVTSYDESFQGKALVYYRDEGGADNWGHKKTLLSPNPAASNTYADETSLDGDQLLIGGPREINTNFFSTGRAFLYQKDEGGIDNWGLVKMLEPTITESSIEYGISVDLNGDHLIIGSEEESSTTGSDAGAAYIYQRNQGGANNWGLVNKLFACDADDEDEFGTSVAIDGGQAIIGADDDSEVITNAGAAYFFQQSTSPLSVDNALITSTNFLQYHSGLDVNSNAQINISGDTTRFKSPTSIELQNTFSVNPLTTLECIIDNCDE